jgi:glyoxylase-like metal-dependent hydrolase (beta-lactamase superfamily II)
MAQPQIHEFFHKATWTLTYLVVDPDTKKAFIIDSAADYDPPSGRLTYEYADTVLDKVKELGVDVEMILETHAHADHLSAAPYLKEKLDNKPQIGIGANILKVQQTFKGIYDFGDEIKADGSQFDVLLNDEQELKLGNIVGKVMFTPGHTPACSTYVLGKNAWVGDTLFAPDSGSARCDFPGGSAETLWASITKILSLGDDTTLWLCHDYQPGGRDLISHATVKEQKETNKHLGGGGITTEEQYVKVRTERDAQLAVPKLLLPSIQCNIIAGNVPPLRAGESVQYIKIPVNRI